MKKIKLIFLNTVIIIFITAFFAFAADVKNPAPAAAKAPVPSPAQPAVAGKPPAQNPVPPVAAAKAPAANPAAPPAPAPTLAPPEVYNYNPMGKPDPFRPFIVLETAEKKKVEKKQPPSIFPLQRVEADQYKVVGIAGDQDQRVAIAEDASKKFYPLFKGTRIGLHDGKVIEIMADRVIVEEYENKKARRVILKLRKN